jgi:hypothetical protein
MVFMAGCEVSGTSSEDNNPPVIEGSPGTRALVNENYSFTPMARDADGDPLSFSIRNLPSWCSFNESTGQLSGVPDAGDLGVYQEILISVSDGQATSSLSAFNLSVTQSDANSPPLISGNPATSVAVNGLYTFTPSASDADNDTLIFDITNPPAWCSFDSATGALSGTPGVDNIGDYQDIVISVSDGTDSAALPAFSISVLSNAAGGSGNSPRLNFSDLISGPGTGLGDGLGSGAIVTVWGQFLGASQGTSSIEYCDSTATCRSGYVYYWKNADGTLPGGPANLYQSHRMQEIAFSIPDSAAGAGEIRVTVGADTSTLPFTVRPGDIYHVKSSGSDPAGDGSFANPWASAEHALSQIEAPGSTLYVHDSIVSDANPHRAIYWNKTVASSGLSNQFGIVAYPGSQPQAVGYSGFRNYTTEGQVVSKYAVFASECDEDSQGQPTNCAVTPSLNLSYGIQSSAYGRAVGNTVTDRPGGCADGQQGAISGNALNARDRVSGYQILGNEIHDYGCTGSSKFHHTTYLSIRSADANLQLDPWRFGWNYLHDNQTKNGIHQYDENNSGTLCGSPNGTVIINDNVIINQSGAGINIGANCPWTNDFKVYNNILVNVGLAFDWDGVDPNTTNGPNTSGISVSDGALMGTVEIHNNTIHTWNGDDQANDTQACLGVQGKGDNVSIIWNDNVCYTNKDKPFVAAGCCGAEVQLDNVTGSNNLWYYSGNSPASAIPPGWDSAGLTQDPLLSIVAATLVVGENSPLIGKSSSGQLTHDVYGAMRSTLSEIGAVQFNQ